MTVALLLAAGTGNRMEMDIPKQFAMIRGKMVMEYSLEIVQENSEVDCFFVVMRERYEKYVKNITEKYSKFRGMVEGGETRQESVLNGLKAINVLNPDKVVVHDCARPFSKTTFSNVLNGLKISKSAIPVLQVKDTLYRIEGNDDAGELKKVEMLDRRNYYTVQTPQGFEYEPIYRAHILAAREGRYDFTDDGSLWIRYVGNVQTVEGAVENIKITYPLELEIAEKIAEFME